MHAAWEVPAQLEGGGGLQYESKVGLCLRKRKHFHSGDSWLHSALTGISIFKTWAAYQGK